MVDQTLALIRRLRPEGQAAAIFLINAYREAGLPAIVVESWRSFERQRALVAAGASKTLQSRHLLGRAMDIAFAGIPTAQVPREWWIAGHSLWSDLGGDPPISWDLVHFQF